MPMKNISQIKLSKTEQNALLEMKERLSGNAAWFKNNPIRV